MVNLINKRLKDNGIPGHVTMTVVSNSPFTWFTIERYFGRSLNEMNNPKLVEESLKQWKNRIKTVLTPEFVCDEAYFIPIKTNSLRYSDCFTMRVRNNKEIKPTDPNFENTDVSFLMKD